VISGVPAQRTRTGRSIANIRVRPIIPIVAMPVSRVYAMCQPMPTPHMSIEVEVEVEAA
jgi:hypothetical protein